MSLKSPAVLVATTAAILCAFLVLPVDARIVPGPVNFTNCSAFLTCGECTRLPPDGNCGWCAGSNLCLNGTSQGSYEDSIGCSQANWNWDNSLCSQVTDNRCWRQTTCTECTTDPKGDCGWCESSKVCLQGTYAGPTTGSCPASSWGWSSDVCLNGGCTQYLTCHACTDATTYSTGSYYCGWCSADNKCHDGTSSGQSSGDCLKTWSFGSEGSTQCSSASNLCEFFFNCHDCAHVSGCGWCGNSDICVAGTSDQPNGGQCVDSWYYGDGSCHSPVQQPSPQEASCWAHRTCTECAPVNGCGWCGGQNICLQINAAYDAPLRGSCNFDWHSFTCPNGNCGQFQSCDSCTSLGNDCGWCSGSNLCLKAQSSGKGPSTGSCSLQNWHRVEANCPTLAPTPVPPTVAPPTPAPTQVLCQQYISCGSCAASPLGDCGWCSTTHRCMKGTSTGPAVGTCPGGASGWEWVTCPATPAPGATQDCAALTTCAECTRSESGTCGFCYDSAAGTGVCAQGTYLGPTAPSTCAWSWEWYSTQCTK